MIKSISRKISFHVIKLAIFLMASIIFTSNSFAVTYCKDTSLDCSDPAKANCGCGLKVNVPYDSDPNHYVTVHIAKATDPTTQQSIRYNDNSAPNPITQYCLAGLPSAGNFSTDINVNIGEVKANLLGCCIENVMEVPCVPPGTLECPCIEKCDNPNDPLTCTDDKCNSLCDSNQCQLCDGAGQCTSCADPDNCMGCNDPNGNDGPVGLCHSLCPKDQVCDGNGNCVENSCKDAADGTKCDLLAKNDKQGECCDDKCKDPAKDFKNDPKNCGQCGNQCPKEMPACVNGDCEATCCPDETQSCHMAINPHEGCTCDETTCKWKCPGCEGIQPYCAGIAENGQAEIYTWWGQINKQTGLLEDSPRCCPLQGNNLNTYACSDKVAKDWSKTDRVFITSACGGGTGGWLTCPCCEKPCYKDANPKDNNPKQNFKVDNTPIPNYKANSCCGSKKDSQNTYTQTCRNNYSQDAQCCEDALWCPSLANHPADDLCCFDPNGNPKVKTCINKDTNNNDCCDGNLICAGRVNANEDKCCTAQEFCVSPTTAHSLCCPNVTDHVCNGDVAANDKCCENGKICNNEGQANVSCDDPTATETDPGTESGSETDPGTESENCTTNSSLCTSGQGCCYSFVSNSYECTELNTIINCGACNTMGAPDCCDSVPVNKQTDSSNCGECGHICSLATGGADCCNGQCVNYQTDVNNCGSCGHACGSGYSCCNGQCKDLKYDDNNCISCGNACSYPNSKCCNSVCVNPMTDTWNCGSCGIICSNGCCNGACCPDIGTETDPGTESSIDSEYNPDNCNVNPGICMSGYTCCNNPSTNFGECINLSRTEYSQNGIPVKNCGICGLSGTLDCCNGVGVDTKTSATNCGYCGGICLYPNTCQNGQCLGTETESTGTSSEEYFL